MWEIGKSLADAEKEFDRTVDYIRDTIDALKDLDRARRASSIEEGIIGADPARAARRGAVHGPVQLSAQRDLHHADPGARHGQPGGRQAAEARRAAASCRSSRRFATLPGGRRQHRVRRRRDGGQSAHDESGERRRPRASSARAGSPTCSSSSTPSRTACARSSGLDAKNPAIVLPDADLDLAVKECVLGRAVVQRPALHGAQADLRARERSPSEFLSRASPRGRRAEGRHAVGAGREDHAAARARQGRRTCEPSSTTRSRRARASSTNGGGTAASTFCCPAVVYPVARRHALYHEEQFGPVVPVAPFDDLDEPMRYVIDVRLRPAGQRLRARPASRSRHCSIRSSNQVCRVNLNTQCQRGPDTFPFTGRKDSAEGTLSVSDALRVFTIRTLVAAKETEANREIIKAIVTNRSSTFLSTDFIL